MKPNLSLILACYNEAEHLNLTFPQLLLILKKTNFSFELIFIDDKSSDNTVSIIKKIILNYPSIPIELLIHRKNEGRGKAVADGVKKAKGDIVGYLDVDLEISPKYILTALERMNKYDVVVGKRQYAFIPKYFHRYLATKCYSFIVKCLLKLPVSDTEAGFKFFNRKKILSVLEMTTNPGWFWYTEIIYFAKKKGLKIGELSVIYKRRLDKTSTVNTVKDSIIYIISLITLLLKR